ncbi:MAG: hypothetical protein Q4E73_05580 [Lachnospiraceae bacterium]|nr:hypothetical protein [Lachnospiraceae bacterium]
MKHKMKRILCLTFIFILAFSVTTFADDGPEDFENDNTTAPEIDFSAPTDTTFDDTIWTIEYEDGTEEEYVPNPMARWKAIEGVAMSLDFKTLGKAVFSTAVATNDTSYDIKIVTKLQSYRNNTWKTLYTKTKTTTISSGMLSGSYYVTKGYKYRTRNAITVYNSSGKVIETYTLNCTRTYK